MASPLLAALMLFLIGAVVSAFASSTAVLGSLIPLAVPFLQGDTGVGAIGFIAGMAVASTIVDVSPFSTNGAWSWPMRAGWTVRSFSANC